MRPITLVALCTVLVALAATQAEARAGRGVGRLFGGTRTPVAAARPGPPSGSVVVVPVAGPARRVVPAAGTAALAAVAAPALAAGTPTTVAEAGPPRPAAPWCPSNRAQSGFCELN